jgi:hypothetical protein
LTIESFAALFNEPMNQSVNESILTRSLSLPVLTSMTDITQSVLRGCFGDYQLIVDDHGAFDRSNRFLNALFHFG